MNSTLGEICRWRAVAYKRFGDLACQVQSEPAGELLQRVTGVVPVVEDQSGGCDERKCCQMCKRNGDSANASPRAFLDVKFAARAEHHSWPKRLSATSFARGTGSRALRHADNKTQYVR